MERRHGKTEPRNEGFQAPRTQVQPEEQAHTQGRYGVILPAAEQTRHDSPLVGMDRDGPVLVVRGGE